MSLIDLILNLAGLLLWISWRYIPFDPINRARPATLTGTLRRAEPMRIRRWHFLLALAALLGARGLFYWWIGGALQWAPGVNLGVITVAFRSDMLDRMLLFSLGSFVQCLFIFHLGLVLLWLLAPRNLDSDPCHRFVRIQLGPLSKWPRGLTVVMPLIVAALAWMAVEPLLDRMRIVPPTDSLVHLAEQSVVLGVGVYVVWKHFIGALLTLHLLNTYVYLGSHPFWNFVNAAGKNLLKPLNWIPLRLGKMDFSPLAGIAISYAAAHLIERGLDRAFQQLPL